MLVSVPVFLNRYDMSRECILQYYSCHQERPDSGQVAAIAADAPAILLVAGAGTGKTRVLAARLAHVLRRRTSAAASGAAASNAQLMTLVLSFSSNAAQEICGQASAIPGGAAATDARAVWAGTFHSFALRLLGQYPYLGTGLSRFTIADPSDQHAAMQAALAELKPTAGGGASTHKLLRRLSVWKEQGLDERRVAAMLRDRWDGDTSSLGDPSRSSRHAHDDREERLASAVYPVYQRCLRARGKVRLQGGVSNDDNLGVQPSRGYYSFSPFICSIHFRN